MPIMRNNQGAHHRKARGGFTLVEICVVASILIALAAIGFGVSAPMREAARQKGCASNLRQMYVVMALYTADHEDAAMYAPGVPLALDALKAVRHFPGSDRVRRCPSSPSCLPPQNSAYVYHTPPSEEFSQQHPAAHAQFWAKFEKLGPDFPIIYCLTHDELVYAPAEKHLHPRFNLPFVVALRADGTVKASRLDMLRINLNKSFCRM